LVKVYPKEVKISRKAGSSPHSREGGSGSETKKNRPSKMHRYSGQALVKERVIEDWK